MAADGAKNEKMHIVVVGPGGVGKSAITLSFVRNMYGGVRKEMGVHIEV